MSVFEAKLCSGRGSKIGEWLTFNRLYQCKTETSLRLGAKVVVRTRGEQMDALGEQIRTDRSVQSTSPSTAVALLTGGFDKPYTLGLATALSSEGVCLDIIGSDEVDAPGLRRLPKVIFLNLRGSLRADASVIGKTMRVLRYYFRLIRYAAFAEPKIFHILWNNKFQTIDRTLLILYYKMLRKRIVLTAHNVNAGKRDANDSFVNRLTLRIQYLLSDHIVVHTEQMKRELRQEFGIGDRFISVMPFGINITVPNTDLSAADAKRRLQIGAGEKVILFFGSVRPYKGLEYLVDAFLQLAAMHPEYRLLIAGSPKEGTEQYLRAIQRKIDGSGLERRITQRFEYIPDPETELYFKAADILALPYTHVFQSGVLFLAYGFGLPVMATDVGSIKEDVVEGRTGFLCRPCDSRDLASGLERYFESDLFKSLPQRRQDVFDYAEARHSWSQVGAMTTDVYARLSR